MAVVLNVGRRLHAADDCFHEAGGNQGGIRLPLLLPGAVLVIGYAPDADEAVLAVSQY